MFQEGQRLGDFEILERLGQGGMGAVYKARQVSLKRFVALKTLQASLASDPEYIARFHREAIAAAGLNHPNLVQVYAAGENEGLHWFAMEFVEGESAQDRLRRKTRLDPEEAIAIATHVATALDYGWRKAQLIHRDIKPDNIFLSNDGEVKLGDLGLAKSAAESQSLTMTGSSMGTPHYVSPEQGQGKKDVDLRADIYSLGCTLFHLVGGEPPFKGDTAMSVMLQHVTAPVPNLRSVWPECPEELARVVMKMMLKQPGARQQNYAEVIADLRRAYDALSGAAMPARVAVTQQPVAQKPARQPSPVAKKPTAAKKGVPVAALAGSGLALLATIAALFYFAPWKKGDQLSEAERREKERAAQGTTPTGAEPGFAPLFGAGGLQDWNKHGGAWTYNDGVLTGRLDTKGFIRLTSNDLSFADYEIRFALRRSGKPTFEFRIDPNANPGQPSGSYFTLDPENVKWTGTVLWFTTHPGSEVRSKLAESMNQQKVWKEGDWNDVRLVAQGRHLMFALNGTQITDTTLDTSAGGNLSGGLGFSMNQGDDKPATVDFRNIRIRRITAPSASAAATTAYPQPAKWIDATAEVRSAGLKQEALAVDGDWLETRKGVTLPLGDGRKFGNVAVRVTYANAMDVCLRETESGKKYFGHVLWHAAIGLTETTVGSAKSKDLKGDLELPAGYKDRTEHELIFAAQGDVLSLWIDGREMATVRDGTLDMGTMSVVLTPGNNKEYKPSRIRKVEYGELPAAPVTQSTSTPATATKDAPFVNTLGMKFVPVSGTQALFCIWETRVKDYEEFARVNNVNDGWTKIQHSGVLASREPEHPVGAVIWNEANAFCKWLTEKERAAGKLPMGMSYRLPTDEEWSRAVGLQPESGATPKDRDGKNTVDFPWGTGFPPPKSKVGNYADSAFHEKFPNGKDKWIEGYTDGYATTAPVGSFAPNKFGIYDLGGNVWEWCEDLYEPGGAERVLRGGAWTIGERLILLSSSRLSRAPGRRDHYNGFRCVLAPSAATSAATMAPPATEPWQDALRDPAKLVLNGGVERTPEGLRFSTSGGAKFHGKDGPQRDGAARMRAAIGGLRPQLLIRESSAGNYQLFVNSQLVQLARYAEASKQWTTLRDFPLRAALKPGESYELELRAVGQTLTAKLNGEVLGSVADATFTEGRFALGVTDHTGTPVLIKAFDVLDLDAPGGASATPSTAYPQPAKWTDATQSLRANFSGKDGFVAEGEWLSIPGSARMFNLTSGQQFRNAIVRIRYSGRVDLALRRKTPRATQNDDLRYEAGIGPATANIGMTRPVGSQASNLLTPIVKLAPSYRPEQEHEAVFAVQGSTLTLWIDGEKILAAQDSTLTTGELAFLMKNDAQYGTCRVRKVEYGELPDTAPAATPTAPAGGWISLMDKIDPAKDAVRGTWTRVADGMFGEDSNRFGHLQLPYHPPEEYDFRMVFTPKAGSGQAEQILAAGGHQFRWKQAGGYEDHFRAAFDAVGGKSFLDSPAFAKLSETAQLNRRYESIVEVRRDRVTGYVDGKKLVEWPTDYHEMSIAAESAIPDTHALGIGLWSGKITFHDISVREVTGTGKIIARVPAANNWISLMDKIDPAVDAIKGQWSRVASGLHGEIENYKGLLQLPYEPPEEYDFRIAYTPTSGLRDAIEILTARGREFRWSAAAYGNVYIGFDRVGGHPIQSSPAAVKLTEPPPYNVRRESLVEVRRDRVIGYIDGKKIVEWKTDYSDMSNEPGWNLRDANRLGIAIYSSKTTFHDISVREVTGTGKLIARVPATDNWISLLDKIDPAADAVKGRWSRVAGGVQSVMNQAEGVLQLPYEPPEEYDFRIAFTPDVGERDGIQLLTARGHEFKWSTAAAYKNPDGTYGFWAGFDRVGGKTTNESPASQQLPGKPPLNKRRESLVEVRRDRVTGYIDGKKMVEWKTDYSDMSRHPNVSLRDANRLGIGVWQSTTTFHEIAVREVTGTGKLLRGAATSPATPAPPPGTGAAPFVPEAGFVPVFGAAGVRDWARGTVGTWAFENGTLACRLDKKGYASVLSKNISLADFEIRFAFRTDGKVHLQFRVNPAPGIGNTRPGIFTLDPMNVKFGGTVLWGGTAGGRSLAQTNARPDLCRRDMWNDVRLTAQGRHFTFALNGTQIFDETVDPAYLGNATGDIAFAVQNDKDGPGTGEFKDIRIRPLVPPR